MRKSAVFASIVLFSFPYVLHADGPIISPEEGLPHIDWKDAGKYLDKEVVVQGPIVAASNSKSICFLNFDKARSFTCIIRKEHLKKFETPPEKMYASRLVRIRGIISEYRNKPQIEVTSPDQITILTKNEPIPEPVKPKTREFKGTITVATYNTLNLFDEYDDPYHSDEGTPAKPRAELEAFAKSIRAIDADVVALQEVENRGYLERFVRAFLSDMGYEHIVAMDSNDQRGIECAVLSRLPVGPVTTYQELRFPDDKGDMLGFQRDFLRVQIEPAKGVSFDMFVVHLKSKRGTSDTERIRSAEARMARKILDGVLEKDPGAVFMICGDFNDTWDSKSLKIVRGEGERELRSFFQDLPKETATFNKKPHVSMIDFIICSPAAAKRYVAKSYRVIPGSPETTGSDHNPVIAEFDVKP